MKTIVILATFAASLAATQAAAQAQGRSMPAATPGAPAKGMGMGMSEMCMGSMAPKTGASASAQAPTKAEQDKMRMACGNMMDHSMMNGGTPAQGRGTAGSASQPPMNMGRQGQGSTQGGGTPAAPSGAAPMPPMTHR